MPAYALADFSMGQCQKIPGQKQLRCTLRFHHRTAEPDDVVVQSVGDSRTVADLREHHAGDDVHAEFFGANKEGLGGGGGGGGLEAGRIPETTNAPELDDEGVEAIGDCDAGTDLEVGGEGAPVECLGAFIPQDGPQTVHRPPCTLGARAHLAPAAPEKA